MTACKQKLEKYLLAILRRVMHLELPQKWMQQLGRISGTALDDISPTGLDCIVEMSLETLSSGSQAAPHLLSLLSASLSHLLQRPKSEEDKVFSIAKVHNVIKRLCETPWPTHLIHAIVMHLHNAGLPEAILETVTAAVSGMCATVDTQFLPDAVHGLLTLPSATTVTHIHAVCELMSQRRERAGCAEAKQELAVAEAELLQRVIDLFAREKLLTNQWLKAFKAEQRPSQFALSLTVMLAGSSRTAAAAMDAVKAVLSGSLKHAEAIRGSAWLQRLPCGQGCTPQELAVLLFETVRDAREGLAAQLTQLGFHLLAAAKLKNVDVASMNVVTDRHDEWLQWWSDCAPASVQLCLAGVALLDQVRSGESRPGLGMYQGGHRISDSLALWNSLRSLPMQVARCHKVHIEPILEHICTQLVGGTCVEAVLQYLLVLRCIFVAHEEELAAHVPAVQVRSTMHGCHWCCHLARIDWLVMLNAFGERLNYCQ